MEVIVTQGCADTFLGEVDWEHAFVREMVLSNKSFQTEERSVVSPGSLPRIDLVIATPSARNGGVRFVLEEVDGIMVWFGSDLEPKVTIERSNISFGLDSNLPEVKCKRLLAELVPAYWGERRILTDPFAEGAV